MENIKISNFDDALKHLSESIANVAKRFAEQDRDDITQACWVRVLTLIKQRGEVDIALLLKCLKQEARRESRLHNNYGLTPRQSKYKPPKRDYGIPDEPHHCVSEEQLRDIELESTGQQERILHAINYLSGEGRKPTVKAIAEMLDTTIETIRWQLKKIRERYHDDKDND